MIGNSRAVLGTLQQVGQLVASFGRGLQSLGQQPGDKVCLYADTRMEWMVAAQVKPGACLNHHVSVDMAYHIQESPQHILSMKVLSHNFVLATRIVQMFNVC